LNNVVQDYECELSILIITYIQKHSVEQIISSKHYTKTTDGLSKSANTGLLRIVVLDAASLTSNKGTSWFGWSGAPLATESTAACRVCRIVAWPSAHAEGDGGY
jgi:hypothetical protein